MELQIETLMEQLVEGGGSDLHLSSGLPPYASVVPYGPCMKRRWPKRVVTA